MRGRKAVACLVIAWSGNSRTVVNAGWREATTPRHFPPSRRALSIPPSRPLMAIRGGADEAQRKEEEEEETEEVVVKSAKEQDKTESTTEETTTESTETLKEGPLLAEQNKDELTEEEQAAQEERRQEAVALRQEGKDLHDEGKWEQAAVTFDKAANILSEINDSNDDSVLEEYATCRLHQALCRLKNQNYQDCVDACSALLTREPPAHIRARALHRRARAKLGLDDTEGALQDARSAAFLGDRKAVALYGKLMRNNGGDESSNPFDAVSSSSLLESLLTKSSDPTGTTDGNPLSSLLLGNNNNKNGNNLAQSVIKSLSKQVENEATQERLCGYLQKTNTAQVQQLLQMAGIPLGESAVKKLVGMCHSVTPRLIQKYVKLSKRLWYGISLVKKVMQLLSKYRLLLIFCLLLAWIKSAIHRPIPINKKALKQAMKAQAAAAAAAATATAEAAATAAV